MRLTLIPLLNCSLSILSFVFPHESPVLSKFTAVGTTIFAFVSLIVIVAVTQLRVVEGVLTCVLIGLFIISQIHAVISASLTDQYAPLLAPEDELDPEVDGGCFASFKRVCGYTASFVGISLPLALGHIAILAATVLITIGVIIRAADASVEQPGFRYKIDPWLWTRSYFPSVNNFPSTLSLFQLLTIVSSRTVSSVEVDSPTLSEVATTEFTSPAVESDSTILHT